MEITKNTEFKILVSEHSLQLEHTIISFIKENESSNIIDVKYSTCSHNNCIIYSAMIIYQPTIVEY